MAVELPTVIFRDGPAPPHGPLPGIRWNEDCLDLDLPGHGWITVSGEGITVSGPDAPAREQVFGQLGTWARGQWFRAQGLTTVNGTCIAMNGRSIVITGAPRAGCSLLALVLLQRGWSLVSDGIVSWGSDAVPVQLDHQVTADRAVVLGIPPEHLTPAVCGRDRVHVQAPTTGTGVIAGSLILGRRLALGAPQIVRTDPSPHTPSPLAERLATSAIPALVPHARPDQGRVPSVPGLRITRPISVNEAVVRSSAPPVLADLIESTLLEWCV